MHVKRARPVAPLSSSSKMTADDESSSTSSTSCVPRVGMKLVGGKDCTARGFDQLRFELKLKDECRWRVELDQFDQLRP